MDIHDVKITTRDLDRVAAEGRPSAEGVSFVGDACSVYREARPALIIAQAVLQFAYPPAAGAVSAAVAILDTACEEFDEEPDEK